MAPRPEKLVYFGAVSAISYLSTKDGEQDEFVHPFGVERDDGAFVGPRPLLYIGQTPGKPPDLVIVRGESRFRVTPHGIED